MAIIERREHTAGRCSRRERTAFRGLALVAVVGLSMLAAACGGGSPSGKVAQIGTTGSTKGSGSSNASGSGSPSDRRGALVAFSACMRKHGVPNFPDPKAVGHGYGLTIDDSMANSPQFKNAQQVCKKLLPNGGRPPAQEQAKQLQEALKYAACIRAHGMPDYPDPKLHAGGGIEMGEAPDSPQFKTAQKACQQLAPP
jgi:hypothetical protein